MDSADKSIMLTIISVAFLLFLMIATCEYFSAAGDTVELKVLKTKCIQYGYAIEKPEQDKKKLKFELLHPGQTIKEK